MKQRRAQPEVPGLLAGPGYYGQAHFHNDRATNDNGQPHVRTHPPHDHWHGSQKTKAGHDHAHARVHRRSQAMILSNNGHSYIVSSSPPGPADQTHTNMKREPDGIEGRVDVQVRVLLLLRPVKFLIQVFRALLQVQQTAKESHLFGSMSLPMIVASRLLRPTTL